MANIVTSDPIRVDALDRDFYRADIEFHGVDHAGASYQARIFLNKPDADENTPRNIPAYAGCFHIFGHGGCLGDVGHCDVKPRRPYDPRPAHPLTPARKTVVATDAVRKALSGDTVTVTVVPVILSTTSRVGLPDEVVKYEEVRILTYR